MKRTKIVATIGPSSNKKEMIRELIKNGADVFRLNFSHGKHEDFFRIIKIIRSLEKDLKRPIAILQDLQGPKIRVGEIDGKIILQKGEIIKIAETQEDEKTIPMEKFIIKNLKKGDEILIADGTIKLEVASIKKSLLGGKLQIFCKVIAAGSGEIISFKGVNLPGIKIDIQPLTEKDERDLEFGLENGVDFVALSFIKNADDLLGVRKIIHHKMTKIIAKIETPEAVADLDRIINVADAIMVARGDLGIEISLENIPRVQKEIIRKCNANAKPVITATQMLGSMVKNPLPTRSEVSDVSNAVLDGTDAVMLSEETAIGAYPQEAVKMMSKIIKESEKIFPFGNLLPNKKEFAISDQVTLAIGDGINHIIKDLDVKAIVAFTESGWTSKVISAFRPSQPILATSSHIEVLRQLSLNFGVVPVKALSLKSTDQMVRQARNIAIKSGLVKRGDKIVISAGIPFGHFGSTNLILVQVL